MAIHQIAVHNPQPNPVLSENQRFIFKHLIVDPIEVINSATVKVLEKPEYLAKFGQSNAAGTLGSLIDLII